MDGKLQIKFPETFNYLNSLNALTLSAVQGVDGTPSVNLLVSFTFTIAEVSFLGNTEISGGTDVSLTWTSIVVPPVANPPGSFVISTHESDDTPIDQVSISQSESFLPGVLTSIDAILDQNAAGATGDASIIFTIDNELPSDGKVVLTFANTISNSATVTQDTSNGAFFSGTVSVNVSSFTLTISRNDDGETVAAGTTMAMKISGVSNPPVSGSSKILSELKTQSKNSWGIDEMLLETEPTVAFEPGTMTSLINAGRPTGGATTFLSFQLQTTNPIPSDGLIVIEIPGMWSPPTLPTFKSALGIDGSFSVSTNGHVITVTRSGGTILTAGSSFTIDIDGFSIPTGLSSSGLFAQLYSATNDATKIDQVASPIAGFTVQNPGVIITPSVLSCSEAGSNKEYNIVLGAEPDSDVTIDLSKNASNAMLTISPASIVFTAANWSDSATITVGLPGDFVFESTAVVEITHVLTSSDTLYSSNPNFLPTDTVSVHVYDNDTPFVLISEL